MKNIVLFTLSLLSLTIFGQKIMLDPGHGERPLGVCVNRPLLECQTNLAVGYYTLAALNSSCKYGAQVRMTRYSSADVGSTPEISISNRAYMSNSWGADRFLSIHCNGGGGTGTETFYCYLPDYNSTPDRSFANKVQWYMVYYGQWVSRRVVEDRSYMPYHFGVLAKTRATSALSEIGFVDRAYDRAKLQNSYWRKQFAKAYYNALVNDMRLKCGYLPKKAPGNFQLIVKADVLEDDNYNVLNWTNAPEAKYYNVYRNGELYASYVYENQYKNWWVNDGEKYSYSVQAINEAGETWNSEGALEVSTLPTKNELGTFSVLGAEKCWSEKSYNRLTWTPSSGATNYQVYRDGVLYFDAGDQTSFNNWNLEKDEKSYTYQIKATNQNSSSWNSNGNIILQVADCTSNNDDQGKTIEEIGIGDFYNNLKLTLSPNPATRELNISLVSKNLSSKVELQVIDLMGNTLITQTNTTKGDQYLTNIDVSKLQPGHYSVRISSENQIFTGQFIKE